MEKTFYDEYLNVEGKRANVNQVGSALVSVDMFSNTATPTANRDGLIVWLPGLAMDAIKRFTLVSTSDTSGAVGALGSPSPFGFSFTIKSTSAFIITQTNINVSPGLDNDAQDQFTLCRVNAGYVDIKSATTSGVTIPGEISAGAVQDISMLFPSGTAASIGQQSTSTKDALLGEQASMGVTMVVGDYMPVNYTRPLIMNSRISTGFSGYETELLTAPVYFSTTSPQNNFVWISPYIDVPAGSMATRPDVPNMSPFTVPYFKIATVITDKTANFGTGSHPSLMVVHFYGSAQEASGSVTMESIALSERFPFVHMDEASSYSLSPQYHYTRPSVTGNLLSNRMWLGTAMQLVWTSGSPLTNAIAISSIRLGNSSRLKEGELGPARVARFSGFGQGQQLTVTGKASYECLMSGGTAPYLKATDSSKGLSLQETIDLNAEFDSSSHSAKRVWRTSEVRKRSRD